MKRSIFLGFLTMISLVPTARVAAQTDAGRGPIMTLTVTKIQIAR